ncbi:MAG: hypothetical protein F4W94_00015 [Acidimicrobiia bacterium]|nr:hypothetical protein [Acidimicrobiia bacterium]
MPPPEPLLRLVTLARRRLWASRLVGEVILGLGVGAAAAAAVWGISRVFVVPAADGVALTLVAVSVAGVLGWWAVNRPSAAQAALWADHRLGGEDRLSTAWELGGRPRLNPAEIRQMKAAGSWAAGADRKGLRGEYPSAWVLTLVGLAVVSAGMMAVSPSVTDQALEDSRRVREVVDREIESVEAVAEQAPEGLSERLSELADRLSEAETLEEALSELSVARLELEERLGPNRLAENTALAGLAARLSRLPVGEGEDPAARLDDLASSLGALTEDQLASLARELADRASDFAGINDQLAEALEEAASALAADGLDPGPASEALQRAAQQVSAAQARAAAASSRAAAAAQLAASEERLRNARDGEGQSGSGGGEGPGQGEGQGSEGGQGGPSGQGPGSGAGQGEIVGGGGGDRPDPSGSGGGQIAGTGDDDPAREPGYSSQTVFEPPPEGLGEEVHVQIDGTESGDAAGSAVAPSVVNAALVPYADRLAEYRSEALESLQRRPLPPHLTEVVQTYFTELEP